MQLCKEFIIKDIKDYSINNDISIIDELEQCNLFVVIDMIKLGNKCDDASAESILNKAMENMTFEQVCEKLAYEVIGQEPDENRASQSNKELGSFSDILEMFYNQIQSVDENLTLSEFNSMSTKYMYKYCDGIQKRLINRKNMQYKEQYENVGMLMSALSGKLKECPQLNDDGTIHKKTLVEKLQELHNR